MQKQIGPINTGRVYFMRWELSSSTNHHSDVSLCNYSTLRRLPADATVGGGLD
jgi:hypothetical protein